uniref:Uncharacterized protein n=1 Tax=Moniliophthora roreri TaxID=221103 RepID=A0A0W0G095_MONRR
MLYRDPKQITPKTLLSMGF